MADGRSSQLRGTTKMTALLDGQSADMAIIMLGDCDIASNHPGVPAGRLKVPDTVSLWPGETQVIPASIDPGGGQPLTPVEATVTAPDGQGIVTANGNKVTGQSVGEGEGDGLRRRADGHRRRSSYGCRFACVQSVRIRPASGTTRHACLMATGPDGQSKAVQAPIESMDKNVVDADPGKPANLLPAPRGRRSFVPFTAARSCLPR